MTLLDAVDLAAPLRVHIVGIGGTGMRAIARVLLAMGHEVHGSDRADSLQLDALASLGAIVHVGHAATHLDRPDLVTRSTAVPDDNPEIAAARAAEVPVHSRADVLAAISRAKPAILVAGTHGKTTTSSMLAAILDEAELEPSFVIGADVARFGSGARWHDAGAWSVLEADESDGTFLDLSPAHAIVTSLDPDHLEYYGSVAALNDAFVRFVDANPGTTVVCLDDADTGPLLGRGDVVTYGVAAEADLRLHEIEEHSFSITAEASWRGEALGRLTVGLPGRHNLLNAAGATAIALTIGVSFDAVAAALSSFGGVARRFQHRGVVAGVTFVDDYAHLPAEVEAAIATASAGEWGRLVGCYQPHRYSRTEALGATFASSFEGLDQLVLTDIYPSGEAPRPGVSGKIVVDAVTDSSPSLDVVWAASLDDVVAHLAATLAAGDLCLTLGAGDLTTVPDRVIDRLARDLDDTAWASAMNSVLATSMVVTDEPLGERTTYRAGGAARFFARTESVADLVRLAQGARSRGLAVLVIGRGSNMLVADSGFDGLAVQLGDEFDRISIRGDRVVAGAAVSLPRLARQVVQAGLTGFEWAVGVPGSVGGAVVMNAGGHGSDMLATLEQARLLDLTTGDISAWTLDQLEMGYRRSAVDAQHVVIDATVRLAGGDVASGEADLREIVAWRREHQPGGQNAGSVFTNPDGDSAGRLIDAAGGKGLRVGSAEVSSKHANFIQVDPGGSADDVFALMRQVVELVRSASGIELEPETRLVGFGPWVDTPQHQGATGTAHGGTT